MGHACSGTFPVHGVLCSEAASGRGCASFSNGLLDKNFCLRAKHGLGVDRSGQTRSPVGVADPRSGRGGFWKALNRAPPPSHSGGGELLTLGFWGLTAPCTLKPSRPSLRFFLGDGLGLFAEIPQGPWFSPLQGRRAGGAAVSESPSFGGTDRSE